MKKIGLQICLAAILAGFAASVVLADNPTEIIPAKVATLTNSCAGKYYAYAQMTNSAGSIWIKPPTNIVVVSGTLTDMSGFAAPYSSYAVVQKRGTTTFSCGSNNITFSATNTASYQLLVLVTSPPPPPTNNQPLTLHVNWQQ